MSLFLQRKIAQQFSLNVLRPARIGLSAVLLQCLLPMAYIAPFRALRYDPARVSVASAVTQPYDKITAGMQERYYAASPFNLVRIILGRSQPGDNTTDNVYTRAAALSQQWRAEGILQRDSAPPDCAANLVNKPLRGWETADFRPESARRKCTGSVGPVDGAADSCGLCGK